MFAASTLSRAAVVAAARAPDADASIASRRAAVAAGALAVALAPRGARARGLPTHECPDELAVGARGLAFCDAVVGDGATPTASSVIKAHYVGRLESGRAFDSSYERGAPLQFKPSQVIQGWGLGICGDGDAIPAMRVGGKRRLVIPPELGYGARGAGGAIPPNATLYFDVELVAVA